MYALIQLFVLGLVLNKSVHSQLCDCVIITSCPKAVDYLKIARSPKNIQFLRNASCGFHSSTPKICCSYFSNVIEEEEIQETPEDSYIANHANLKLLPMECGSIKGDRIIGGKIADLYEFPSMALISHDNQYGRDFGCGGTIINKRYVLTAAHCVKNKRIAGVRLGEYDLNAEVDCQKGVCEKHIQDMEVQIEVIHDKYNIHQKGIHDIALLRLKEDLDFNHRNVFPMCLPTTSRLRHQDLSNKTALVTGWGLTEHNNYPSVLHKVDLPIVSTENCSEIYNRYSKPGDPDAITNQLCAGVPTKDSCKGDSGGPLMLEENYNNEVRYVQYGIISHGPDRCGSEDPGAYVDITKYMGWILDNISP